MEVFENLERNARWHPAVTKYFVDDCGLETVEDFMSHFKSPEDWVDIKNIKDDKGIRIQPVNRGRVAQMIDRCHKAQAEAKRLKTHGESSKDLDELLGPNDLKARWQKFWNRHHYVVPVEEMCGDAIVSRNFNEVTKRQLRNQDVSKVKGVTQERRQTQRIEDVGSAGPGAVLQVRTGASEDNYTRERTVAGYLAGLSMYLLAHVLNGFDRVIPQPTEPERADTEPTDYWHFPLSFAIAYVKRAQVHADSLPSNSAYSMLRQRDEEEG